MDKMNKWARKKLDKRTAILKQRPYEGLTFSEKLEIIYEKLSHYPRLSKLTYDEFVMLCSVDDSAEFYYQEKGYGVGCEPNNLKKRIFLIGVNYEDDKCTWEKEEIYSSLDELLEQVRIDGKTIKEIWNEVIC